MKIISLKMGEDPTGFISKQQALPRLDRTADEIAKEVNSLLLEDQATSSRLQEVVDLNTTPLGRAELDDEIPF